MPSFGVMTDMQNLAAINLSLWRGINCLFNELSFELKGGTCLLVRGPNGSGKTTLLRVLSGLTRPEAGHIEWQGEAIDSGKSTYSAALAYFGHANGLKADLTVSQNLRFWAGIHAFNDADIKDVLGALDLTGCEHLEARYLSAGQQRRTALARLLMTRASVWLLDEPLTNLDAAGRDYMTMRLQKHIEASGIAIVATHEPIGLQNLNMQELTLGVAA